MALVTANQFKLTPNIVESFARGRQQGQQITARDMAIEDQAMKRQRDQQAAQQQASINQFSAQALRGTPQALQQVAAADPDQAMKIQSFLAGQDESTRAEIAREEESLGRSALNALSLPKEQRRAFIAQERQRFLNEGRDVSKVDSALAMEDDAALENALKFQIRQAQDVSDVISQQFPSKAKKEDRQLRERELTLKEQAEERQSTKMSAGLEKALLTSQDAVVDAGRRATEFDILADQVEAADLVGGVQSTTTETLKRLLGSQDDVTELRRGFNKVRLSEGLKNLPPGPATDRDVQEAFKGVPPENAPASQIASFLRGAAKMARFDAGYNQYKSDFISKNRTAAGLNKGWRESVNSSVLGRDVTIAEIYAEAASEGISPEDVKAELGVQ